MDSSFVLKLGFRALHWLPAAALIAVIGHGHCKLSQHRTQIRGKSRSFESRIRRAETPNPKLYAVGGFWWRCGPLCRGMNFRILRLGFFSNYFPIVI